MGAEEPRAGAQALGCRPRGELGSFWSCSSLVKRYSAAAALGRGPCWQGRAAVWHGCAAAPNQAAACWGEMRCLPCRPTLPWPIHPVLQGILQPAELEAVVSSKHPPLLALQVRLGECICRP